jgi:hypothetical protein
MRKGIILLFIAFSFIAQQAPAIGLNEVNIDAETISAMTSAYALQGVTEQNNLSYFSRIRQHYTSSELATAGIFSSKFLDQKAMRDESLFGSKEENYYYQRIRTLVKDMIMPKIWDVGKLMIEHPDKALYWGPYLIKTCDEVKMLCMEFETVVTNGTCTFSDIEFLVVSEQLKRVLDLAKIGGVDWGKAWDDLSDIGSQITLDNIKDDLMKFIANCSDIASAGLDVMSDEWANASSCGSLLSQKPKQLVQTYKKFKSLADQLSEKSLGNYINYLLKKNGKPSLSKLFSVDEYNISSMVSDYLHELNGQYYTQVYYIYSADRGRKVLCDYKPTVYDDRDDERWNQEWFHYVSPQDDCYHHTLTESEKQQLLKLAESNSGWSQAKVAAYNKAHPGHQCTISVTLLHEDRVEQYKHGWGATHTKWHCFFAYGIKVEDTWDIQHQVYSDVFDSYSMSKQAFDAKMNAKLSYYTRLEDGNTYYIGHEDKVYYSATDAAKIKGMASVSFILNCNNETNMGEGTISWKENGDQGASLTENSKGYAMQTTLSENQDGDKLKAQIDKLNLQISETENQIDKQENRLSQLERLMRTPRGYNQYLKEYNVTKDYIEVLKMRLAGYKKDRDKYQSQYEEYQDDQSETKDDITRIPSVMYQLQSAYNLSWIDEGHWEGYTFIRKAHLGKLEGTVTFTATLSVLRGPKHFLGIRIHRAILAVDWSLKSSASSKDVVESLELDQSKTEDENAKIVNDKASQIALAHPGCSVNLEYYKVAGTDSDDVDNKFHLLWIDDRLEVARKIESRLSHIYTQLVMVEKYMYNEKSLLQHLKDEVWNGVSAYRRGTIATNALAHWIKNAKSIGKKGGTTSSESGQATFQGGDIGKEIDERIGDYE